MECRHSHDDQPVPQCSVRRFLRSDRSRAPIFTVDVRRVSVARVSVGGPATSDSSTRRETPRNGTRRRSNILRVLLDTTRTASCRDNSRARGPTTRFHGSHVTSGCIEAEEKGDKVRARRSSRKRNDRLAATADYKCNRCVICVICRVVTATAAETALITSSAALAAESPAGARSRALSLPLFLSRSLPLPFSFSFLAVGVAVPSPGARRPRDARETGTVVWARPIRAGRRTSRAFRG